MIDDTSRDMGLTIRTLCLKECQFPLRNSVFWVHVCTAPDPKNIYVGYMWDILAFWDGNRNNHGKRSHIYPTHIQLFPSYLYHYNMGITGIHWVGICQNPWIYQLLLCSNTGCWAHKTPSEPSALGYKNNLFLWRLGGSSHRSQGVFTTRAMASPGFTCAICKWTRIIIKIICICSS